MTVTDSGVRGIRSPVALGKALAAFSCCAAVFVCGIGLTAGCRERSPAPAAAPASADSALLCSSDGTLVLVESAGSRPLTPQPPAQLIGMARAGQRIIGVSEDNIYILNSDRAAAAHWTGLVALASMPGSPQLLRAISQTDRAVVWLRGSEPGTLKGAVAIDSQGTFKHHDTATALSTFGSPFSAGSAPGAVTGELPAALHAVVPQASQVLFEQRIPGWAGRLVAPDLGPTGEDGDWPDAPLYYLPDAPGAVPVALVHHGKPLSFRGLLDCSPSGEVLFDGRFAAALGVVLVISPLAHSPPRPLKNTTPPCIFLPKATLPSGLSAVSTG